MAIYTAIFKTYLIASKDRKDTALSKYIWEVTKKMAENLAVFRFVRPNHLSKWMIINAFSMCTDQRISFGKYTTRVKLIYIAWVCWSLQYFAWGSRINNAGIKPSEKKNWIQKYLYLLIFIYSQFHESPMVLPTDVDKRYFSTIFPSNFLLILFFFFFFLTFQAYLYFSFHILFAVFLFLFFSPLSYFTDCLPLLLFRFFFLSKVSFFLFTAFFSSFLFSFHLLLSSFLPLRHCEFLYQITDTTKLFRAIFSAAGCLFATPYLIFMQIIFSAAGLFRTILKSLLVL